MDHAWRRDAAHPGNISQPYLRTGLGIDQEVLDIVEVLADVRVSPDHDVEHFLLLKQAAHRDPADQRRRGPAHVTGLKTVLPGFLEIDLDGDFLLLGLRLDLRALDSTDSRQNLPNLFCLGAENAKIFPVDAHGDRLILAGQGLAHLPGEIGVHLAVDSGLGSDHLLHGHQRRLVVGLWIQAYPDLRRIRVGDIMRQQRAADLRRRVAHSRDRPQIVNERCGEAIHRLHGCARWRLQFDEYVGLLEGRDQRAFQLRPGKNRNHDPGCHASQGESRRAQRGPGHAAVKPLDPAHESGSARQRPGCAR